ncbi:MAG: hypothetical protein RLZZ491_133 [Pseudomonadota bacterium]
MFRGNIARPGGMGRVPCRDIRLQERLDPRGDAW